MKVFYNNNKTKKICENIKEARKKYNEKNGTSLLGIITHIKSSDGIMDIINFPRYNFHKYNNKDIFSIDIGGRRSNCRLLIELLDKDGKKFEPCNIDEIYEDVKCILIRGVENHDSNKRI